jgi:hypothetical protein
MKISFTKTQYEALIKAVYIGNGMVNSVADDREENEYRAIEEYILSFAKAFGLEHYADYDEAAGKYVPSPRLQEDTAVREYIYRYDDYTFWDKLVFNLARQDMAKEYGEEAVTKMSEEERFVKEQPFAEKYEKEFSTNGLRNLTIKATQD